MQFIYHNSVRFCWLFYCLQCKQVKLWTLNFTPMKWFFDRIRQLSLHSSWSDQKIRCRNPWIRWTYMYSDGNGLLLQRTVGNFNTKTTPHGKSTRNRTLQKVSWNSLKIHSFDFWNGRHGRPYVWKCNFFRTQRKHWMKIMTHFWMALEMKTILWMVAV